MKRNGIILAILLISIIFNVYLSIDKYSNRPESISRPDSDQFFQLVSKIDENFDIDGYSEILGTDNALLFLPDNASAMEFYDHSKMFVYKDNVKNSMILLQVNQSEFKNNVTEEWIASFDYSPASFNKEESENFNENVPKVLLCTNSFRYKDFYFTTTCFTDEKTDLLAPTELTAFTNELIEYLRTII